MPVKVCKFWCEVDVCALSAVLSVIWRSSERRSLWVRSFLPLRGHEYKFICTLTIEDNPETMNKPKMPFLRTLGEELSITVDLSTCDFHGELDETHIKIPFEAFGCQVRHVYWPKSKHGKANTTKRASKVIVKVSPKYHSKNTLINCQGTMDLQDAGRVAEWPRKLLINLPYGDGRNKWYNAIYDIYDWKSNPPCQLMLCQGCHRPQAAGCYSDCRFAQTGRREELALARAQEKETKELFRKWAYEARASMEVPLDPCPDFLLGLCREQTVDEEGNQECTKGTHLSNEEAKGITCCITKARGAIKARFLALSPPWEYCIQGPRCVYDHKGWGPENMQRALRLRNEEREKAVAALMDTSAPAQVQPQVQPTAPPTTPTREEAWPLPRESPRQKGRYIKIIHRLTPPPRHHEINHKITRKIRKRHIKKARERDRTPTRRKHIRPSKRGI